MVELNVLVASSADEQWPAISNGIRSVLPEASLLRVTDGAQALRFLFEIGLLTARPMIPDLVVIDETLVAVSSLEVLRRIRGDERTRWAPVLYLQRESQILREDQRTHFVQSFNASNAATAVAEGIRKLRWV